MARHHHQGWNHAGPVVAECRCTAAGWRIARYRLTVTFSDGERRLMGPAYRKATGRL